MRLLPHQHRLCRCLLLVGHPPPQGHPPAPRQTYPTSPHRRLFSLPAAKPTKRRTGGREWTAPNLGEPPAPIWCALMLVSCPIATQRLEQGRRARGRGNPGTPAKGALPPWTPSFFGKGEGGGNLAQLSGRDSALLIASNAANRQYGKLAIRWGFRESPKPSRQFVVS